MAKEIKKKQKEMEDDVDIKVGDKTSRELNANALGEKKIDEGQFHAEKK